MICVPDDCVIKMKSGRAVAEDSCCDNVGLYQHVWEMRHINVGRFSKEEKM